MPATGQRNRLQLLRGYGFAQRHPSDIDPSWSQSQIPREESLTGPSGARLSCFGQSALARKKGTSRGTNMTLEYTSLGPCASESGGDQWRGGAVSRKKNQCGLDRNS